MTKARILANLGAVTSSATELNTLDGITADVTDLNYTKSLYDTGISGGIITTYTGYKVHTFVSSGVFYANTAKTVDILVVGAGGAGPRSREMAGGGTGGV